MKMSTGKLFAASALALAVGSGTSAQAAGVWDGGGDGTSWHDPLNWDDDTVPANSTADFKLNGNYTVNLNADSWTYFVNNSLLTGGGSGEYRGVDRFLVGDEFVLGTQVLNFDYGDGNTFRFTQNASGVLGGRNGQNSSLNHLGGNTIIESNSFTIGKDAGSTGLLTVTGGTFTIQREASGQSLSVGPAGNGTVQVSGGSFLTRAGVTVGGSGTFEIIGTGASQVGIGSSGSVDGSWTQNAGGILSLAIDGATANGVTTLFIDEMGDDGGGNVTFASGALLDLSFNSGMQAGSWDVMTWEGTLTDNGLALSGTTASDWSFEFVDTGGAAGADTLRVTFVPEPASLALVGLGGLMLVGRRRKA